MPYIEDINRQYIYSILILYIIADRNLLLARHPRLELLEEVVALVIDEDESREVFNCDLPDSLHAKLRIFYTLDALDRAL